MKIASFCVAGRSSYGLVKDNGLVDLAARTGIPSLRELIVAQGLTQAKAHARSQTDFDIGSVTFQPVIPVPEHIVCVGINYASHVAEVANAGIKRAIPDKPSVFLRCTDSLTAHRQPLTLPRVSTSLDYEGELAVVIGKPGRYIAREHALGHVAGYTCFNDGSVRDWQFHTNNITPGKNFPSTGALGPWLSTSEDIDDPQRLEIRTTLNGKIMQQGNTSDMIFDVREIIAYVSSFIALAPGDIIATGTPEGVGFSRKPPIYMADGDVCTIEIESIGQLVNPVCREDL